ncbi:MAG: HEAT repeat domain-containing protein [Gemmatimonadetes bacterium]|nr:HEAT repeat domain-containing protein [Gemmatimonadota bacterium]
MPSMMTMTRSGVLAGLAALGIAGVSAAGIQAQWPVNPQEQAAVERARAALEVAHAKMQRVGLAAELDVRQAAMEQSRAEVEAVRESMELARADMELAVPPEPWLQQDPAAKSYQAAREALTAGRYAEAAKAFAALRSAYPTSGYVADSYYYQAFALYRVGGTRDLKSALELLAAQKEEFPDARNRADAETLRVRLESQLARQGDAAAAEAVAQQAADPCKSDEQSVRLAALSALMNMNADQAMPLLKEVLKSRDTCSAQLRRQAVFIVAQKMTDESVGILLDLAYRNPDPDPEVREQAVFWLSQVHSEEALAALQSILKNSKDESMQEKAIFALSQQGSVGAIQTLKEYAERADAPPKLRETAIFWIAQTPKAGGAKYLIDLYPRLETNALKEKTIASIGQRKLPEGHAWLLARARDPSESVDVRKNALFWAGQSGALSGAELKELYGTLTDPDMKKQVIFVASQSKDKDAVDFLMDVAKTEKDPELRKTAVFWLGQSTDPRVAEFLLSLIRG